MVSCGVAVMTPLQNTGTNGRGKKFSPEWYNVDGFGCIWFGWCDWRAFLDDTDLVENTESLPPVGEVD